MIDIHKNLTEGYQGIGRHREQVIDKVYSCKDKHYLDEIRRTVISLVSTPGWFIVPEYEEDEQYCEDIGPFDTLEEAVTYLTLINEQPND